MSLPPRWNLLIGISTPYFRSRFIEFYFGGPFIPSSMRTTALSWSAGLLPGELSDPLFFYFWPGPMPDTTESLQVGPVAVGSKKNQLTRSTCIAWSRVGALAANPWRTFHKDGLQFRHPKYWPEFNFFFKNNIYGPLPSWPLYSFNLFMRIFSWVKRLDGTAPSDQKGFRSKEVDSAA